ncbi:MAG: apolipoprotein N-acyltransferase [Pirellulales bacterium]|nr:apolipoprotein N-acyltransferase [Pirellulales bacterium]
MTPRLDAWARSTFGPALAGAALYWAALPPLDAWPLAWLAPVPWIALARRDTLAGRRPYRALWLAGFLFWLAAYQFIRLPHPANYLGWTALAAYLGCYPPVFVGLSRIGVHCLRLPVILVAPVVWTGLELARAHLLTGITLGALGHTQYRWIGLIQVSDLGGAYAVDFVIVFVAACLARMLPVGAGDEAAREIDEKPRQADERKSPRPRPLSRLWERGVLAFWPAVVAGAMLGGVLAYGHFRMAVELGETLGRVGLIQGSIDVQLKMDEKKIDFIHSHYERLSEEACRRWPGLDLVVWPETMFRAPLASADLEAPPPPDWNDAPAAFKAHLARVIEESREPMIDLARSLGAPALLGVETLHYSAAGVRRFNSAVIVTPDGRVSDRYDKMHRVLFGEYVPFADRWPWLARFTPLKFGLTAGTRPVLLESGRLRIAPNICFENVLPHVIRRQVATLVAEGREPDVLVNLTNDGWFYGSSELDMHLVCGVFRAVECRKPMLIAANTGFSAWIDGDGRILARGPRREPDVLLATVARDPRASGYLRHGDWFSGTCLVASVLLGLVGVWGWWRRPR